LQAEAQSVQLAEVQQMLLALHFQWQQEIEDEVGAAWPHSQHWQVWPPHESLASAAEASL
jgi:hypothetical protein